jgi:calcineurin-like phosphoesterase family protein
MKLRETSKSKIWFCSDSHYNHSNICSATSKWPEGSKVRNFPSLQDMNDSLVESINSRVMEDDFLIHLGDWSFGGFDSIKEFRSRINCKNIILILGNHDHHIERNKDNIQSIFSSVNYYLHLEVKRELTSGQMMTSDPGYIKFALMHYPIASWNGISDGVIHLHGHVHFNPEEKFGPGKMMDVGFDGSEEFRPYSLTEVIDLMKNRPTASLLKGDHHV